VIQDIARSSLRKLIQRACIECHRNHGGHAEASRYEVQGTSAERGRPHAKRPCPTCGREIPDLTIPPEHLKWYKWEPFRIWDRVEWCGHRVEGIPVSTEDVDSKDERIPARQRGGPIQRRGAASNRGWKYGGLDATDRRGRRR
jgi:hypothetical protein